MTAMNHPFGDAKWIGGTEEVVSPIILRRFNAEKVSRATLYITGLGYFEAKINDKLVSEDRFVPLVSDYEPRDLSKFAYPLHDTLTHRIYYNVYDVTALLADGANTLAIQLGNGFYRQTERNCEGKVDFGDTLKALYALELETTDGIVKLYSDGTETWKESEITYSNLFIGEKIDARVQGEEKPVFILPTPEATLTEQTGTPDRVIRRIKPKFVGYCETRAIYDVGENITGVVRIHTSAPAGTEIRMAYSEELQKHLELNYCSIGWECIGASGLNQIPRDAFITDGTSRWFEPKFTWHGFRYFEVGGPVDDLEVLVIHSDVPVTSTFDSPSEGLNFLFDAYIRTQLDNMHGSIPSDCPHRERLGYTGDGQVCAPTVMMMMDSRKFYDKWIQDILDGQDVNNGHVQHTAPLMGGGGGPGGWGCAIVLVPYAYYKQYGDTAMVEHTYEPMRRYMDYLEKHSENGLVVREEEGGWCLGEWVTPGPNVLPVPFVNTCYYLKCQNLLVEMAKAIGKEQDIPAYEAKIAELTAAIKANYYDAEKDTYCGGVQGADAFAVWAGLAGAEMAAKLAEKYLELGRFDTGFLCTDILTDVLMEYGYGDAVLKLLEGEGVGTFLYMKSKEATTIWETWHGTVSHNHPMFGACARQLFTGFLGIRQKKGTVGYKTIEIAPRIPEKLDYASGSIEAPQGKISVSWKKVDGKINFEVQIPCGIDAEFVYGGEKKALSCGMNAFAL